MIILIDLVVIGIIILSTYLGYKKGLIGVAFKILSFIIAIIISGTKIEEGEKIKKEETDLPGIVVNYINSGIESTVIQAQESIAQMVSKNLSQSIIQILTMIILFTITRILLIFAKVILEAVSELPIVKQFNEIGGILYGILRGFIIIYAILAIASFVLPIINQNTLLGTIQHTIITKILYNHNIILMLFF